MNGQAREYTGRAMVVVGLVFYAIGWLALMLDAGPKVYGPPFALTASLWMMQWFIRP